METPHYPSAGYIGSMYKREPMPGKVDKLWFARALEARNMSGRDLAKAMKMDPSAVSRMLNGRRMIKTHEAARMAEVLGVPVREVLERTGVKVDSKTAIAERGMAPVVGRVDAQGKVHRQGLAGSNVTVAPPDAPKDVAALRYQTTLTALDAIDGWLVYYWPQQSVAEDALGRLCVVTTVDGEQWVGFLRRGYDKNAYTLLPLMGGTPMELSLQDASPVLWIRP